MNNNQKDDKSGASGGPSLEDLMRRLEKFMAENNCNTPCYGLPNYPLITFIRSLIVY
jgi:hypothetical protein